MRRQGCKIDVVWSTDSCVRISSVEFWVACFFHSYFFQKHLFVFHHFLPKISQSLYKTHATKAQTSKMHAILADLHDRQQSAPQFPSVLLTIDRHDLHMLVWVTLASFVGFHMFFQERKPAKVREQETDGQGRADWEYCVRLVTSGFGALFFQHYYLTIFNPSASFLKFADIYIFWLCCLCCPLFSCQHPLETWKAWNWLPNSANGEQVVEKVLRSPKMVSHSVPARRDEGIWWIVGICFSKGKRRENFGFGHADKTSRCLPCGGLSSNNESGISIKRILSCWPSGHQIRKVYVAENNDIPTTSTLVCYTYCYTSRTVLDA